MGGRGGAGREGARKKTDRALARLGSARAHARTRVHTHTHTRTNERTLKNATGARVKTCLICPGNFRGLFRTRKRHVMCEVEAAKCPHFILTS